MRTTRAGDWELRDSEEIVAGNEALLGQKHLLVALTRVRNEALLLPTRSTISRPKSTRSSPMTTRARMKRSAFSANIRRWR